MSKAYAVLSDPEKRRQYDLLGEEGLNASAQHQHFQQDFSPDDIFRMFFGNDFDNRGKSVQWNLR